MEGRLTFEFPKGSVVSKYDGWAFYHNQFGKAFGGTKAVDFVYVDERQTWLIEVKDYRAYPRTKSDDIWKEVGLKVRDSLAGLVAARSNANDPQEQTIARKALAKDELRVVLHLEQPTKHSKLFPRVIDPSKVLAKMKQLLRGVDAHPCVVDQHSLKPEMSWTVTG